jgi:ubiquinone/menaquinone biosynthesis C-methylase UbiE
MEPSGGMIDTTISNIWTKGTAEHIPFHDNYFNGLYSTWAYFLAGVDKRKGLAEVERVMKKNGKIIIIDNEGNDEFYQITYSKEAYELIKDKFFQRELNINL